MFGDGSLTFREFAMREPLPLATIHDAVLDFLRGRDDAVLYGAQAVNAYVDEPRMTQDVDIASPRGGVGRGVERFSKQALSHCRGCAKCARGDRLSYLPSAKADESPFGRCTP